MDRMLDDHFRHEATGDIDAVLSTLSADATHDIVGWPTGPTKGRENARPFYQALFNDLEESSAICVKRVYGDNFVVDESVVQFKAVGRPFGFEDRGAWCRRDCCTSLSSRAMVGSSVKTRGSTWLH